MSATSPHFSNSELACPCCGLNNCIPQLLSMLEAFRKQVGRPIIINSAYRCEAHNRAIGGAKNSYHLRGMAADVSVPEMTAAQLEAAALETPLVKGIGRDDRRRFVHLDVRDTKAHWCYDSAGKQCAYFPPK